MTILQVSTAEQGGGAERIARSLFEAYRRKGHRSHLVVGRGATSDPDVHALERGPSRLSHLLAGPGRLYDRWRGLESFRYPASRNLPGLVDTPPDIIHAHNLHGGYFDLRVLPGLGRRAPVVLTLHDAWLLSGHCAHSFDCDRWRTGCGDCPDLTIYPSIRRDATAVNWRRKQRILEDSVLHIATPSEWLMRRVESSMLAAAARTMRVIPNGVDAGTFAPGDPAAARERLGLPEAARIILVAGQSLRTNEFKDWPTARAGAARAAAMVDTTEAPVVLVALGADGEPERVGPLDIRPVPFERDVTRLADWFRAADVCLHAARADTFPGAIVEALACGTPVVATAVGGIPEQVRSLDPASGGEGHGADQATGILVAAGDEAATGRALARLLDDEPLRLRLGANGARDARRRFDFERQRDAYLDWYGELLEQQPGRRIRSPARAAPDRSAAPTG